MSNIDPDADTGPVPTLDEVHASRALARDAAEQTYVVAADHLPRAVKRIARDQARITSRRLGLIGIGFAMLVALAMSSVALSYASGAQATAASAKQTVDTALVKLGQANVTLKDRGQAPVATPAAPTPTDAITAAVLAQVLASLPATPTADQVASRLQASVTANVLGPTMDELSAQVADYFSANPPKPGPPPTAAAIDAAVARQLAANPPPAGKDGETGGKGDPCLPSDPACRGPAGAQGATGETGAAGRSVVTGPEPIRLDNGDCVWRTTYDQPPLLEEHPASSAACPGIGLLG